MRRESIVAQPVDALNTKVAMIQHRNVRTDMMTGMIDATVNVSTSARLATTSANVRDLRAPVG